MCIQRPEKRVASEWYKLEVTPIKVLHVSLQAANHKSLAEHNTPAEQLTQRQQKVLGSLSAINESLLAVFIMANVMTGATNLAIDTKAQTNLVSIAIVSAYMGVLCFVADALSRPEHHNIVAKDHD